MANDRIFLVCKECGEQKMLYKFYPGEGYVKSAIELTKWMNIHLHERMFDFKLYGDPGFTLVTESNLPEGDTNVHGSVPPM